jgi:hypothetical protein
MLPVVPSRLDQGTEKGHTIEQPRPSATCILFTANEQQKHRQKQVSSKIFPKKTKKMVPATRFELARIAPVEIVMNNNLNLPP